MRTIRKMTRNGKKPELAVLTGRPRMPVPSTEAMVTKKLCTGGRDFVRFFHISNLLSLQLGRSLEKLTGL